MARSQVPNWLREEWWTVNPHPAFPYYPFSSGSVYFRDPHKNAFHSSYEHFHLLGLVKAACRGHAVFVHLQNNRIWNFNPCISKRMFMDLYSLYWIPYKPWEHPSRLLYLQDLWEEKEYFYHE